MRTMDLWYAHMSDDRPAGRDQQSSPPTGSGTKDGKAGKRARKARAAKARQGGRARAGAGSAARAAQRAEKNLRKAHTRDSLQALSKLGEIVDGHYRIVSQPPIVVPLRDIETAVPA